MVVRVLSEWVGSPACGSVADVPDALAIDRIRDGSAERVEVARVQAQPETASVAPSETAVAFKKGRRR